VLGGMFADVFGLVWHLYGPKVDDEESLTTSTSDKHRAESVTRLAWHRQSTLKVVK
jgi:hypothetical protein